MQKNWDKLWNVFSVSRAVDCLKSGRDDDIVNLELEYNNNKSGLQPVTRPVEQIPLLRGLGWVQSPFGAMAKQTDRKTD